MRAQRTVEHVTTETLVDYFGHRLPEHEEANVEKHIADCDECTALARRVRRVSHAMSKWTAKVHSSAKRRTGG